jgi:hypothetical protein
MSGGMPYHLEKGPVLTLIETYINKPQPGKRQVLSALRQAESSAPASPKWVLDALPTLWSDPAFVKVPGITDHIIEHWFGLEKQGTEWVAPSPPKPTTGEWLDYKGDVHTIVRRTLRWALEVSLGLMPGDNGPGRPHPAPIELFWLCGLQWFEGWVVQRPTGNGGRTVTVIFVTPTHLGAEVAKSPIAHVAKTMSGTSAHAAPSKENDYEVVMFPPDPAVAPPPPRPKAVDRPYGTWVVTHSNHVRPDELKNNSEPSVMGGVTDPPTLAEYTGVDPVVVLSPSVPAGGVPYNGVITVVQP